MVDSFLLDVVRLQFIFHAFGDDMFFLRQPELNRLFDLHGFDLVECLPGKTFGNCVFSSH